MILQGFEKDLVMPLRIWWFLKGLVRSSDSLRACDGFDDAFKDVVRPSKIF